MKTKKNAKYKKKKNNMLKAYPTTDSVWITSAVFQKKKWKRAMKILINTESTKEIDYTEIYKI